MQEKILEGTSVLLASEPVKKNKPKLLPMSLFYSMAKRRADNMLRGDIFKYYPKQAQRMQGIADGAGVGLPSILFMQMMEMLFGCTALAFSRDRTSTSETILAKNFDYFSFLAPYNFACETKPAEGYKTLGFKMCSLPGIFDGMNECGLAVTYNLARSTDKPEFFVPTSIMLQEMLETCATVDDAVRMITQSKRGGHDCLITLAEPSGNIKAIELSSHFATVREMTNGQVINTNNYQTAEMQGREVPLDTAPSYSNSPIRLDRASGLLKDAVLVDEKAICAVLRDHGQEGVPGKTICRHAEFGCTQRSMIFYPGGKTIKVLFGNPCQGEYQEIGFA